MVQGGEEGDPSVAVFGSQAEANEFVENVEHNNDDDSNHTFVSTFHFPTTRNLPVGAALAMNGFDPMPGSQWLPLPGSPAAIHADAITEEEIVQNVASMSISQEETKEETEAVQETKEETESPPPRRSRRLSGEQPPQEVSSKYIISILESQNRKSEDYIKPPQNYLKTHQTTKPHIFYFIITGWV